METEDERSTEKKKLTGYRRIDRHVARTKPGGCIRQAWRYNTHPMPWRSRQCGAGAVAALLLAVFSSEALVNPLAMSSASGWCVSGVATDGVDRPPSSDACGGSSPTHDSDNTEDDDESQITVLPAPLWNRPGTARRQIPVVKIAGVPPWHHRFTAPDRVHRSTSAADRANGIVHAVVNPNHRSHAPPLVG